MSFVRCSCIDRCSNCPLAVQTCSNDAAGVFEQPSDRCRPMLLLSEMGYWPANIHVAVLVGARTGHWHIMSEMVRYGECMR